MAWYRAGTITSAGNVITGVGTKWLDNKMGIGAGQMLLVPGDGPVKMYEILAVDSDTKLRLVTIPSPALSGAYAIVSFYNDSFPDFARRLAAQLSYYQSQMDGWQKIMTGTGNVTIIAPDGTSVVIPSFSSLVTKQQFDTLSNDAFTASKIVNTQWINLTLLNGWILPVGFAARAVYRKVLGLIFIEMYISGGAAASIAFTLPAGYRPTKATFVTSIAGTPSNPATSVPRLTIGTNGNGTIYDVAPGSVAGVSLCFSLE
ncbi:hypothetical protein [Yersinia kristensenii]|uniref:hypothetical protein n=1 Tax=Yersinia kristensenii TaxID=28152 RepID=UPI0001A5401C|nr:hypothetical protein [Yersinia kristensenii]EEP91825.1 hypothetical protein ykris0001_9510 [Yersinia kristensenii ATCC 33638]PEH53404.1 hypothetical protein CRM81_08695 [Yersinia kristensenii]SUP67162.1 phage protein [Yersinia kristensenii]